MLDPVDYINYIINEILTAIFNSYIMLGTYLNNLYFSRFRKNIDPTIFDPTTFKNDYPLVFVHGFLGVADLDFLGIEQYILDYIKYKIGGQLVQAKVAPTASDEDRAVQLYYDMVGGNEVYRNLTEYNGLPVPQPVIGRREIRAKVPGWGTKHPVHFICHSMGATTVGRLETILRDKTLRTHYFGDDIPPELRDSPDSSPWFKSIMTLSGNCKGTTGMDLLCVEHNIRSQGFFILLFYGLFGYIYSLSTRYSAFRLLYDSKLDYIVKIDPNFLSFFAYPNKVNLNANRAAKNDLFNIDNNIPKYNINPDIYYLYCVNNDSVRLKNKKYTFIKNSLLQPFSDWFMGVIGAHYPSKDVGIRQRQSDIIVPTLNQKGYDYDCTWIKIKDRDIIRELYEDENFEHPEIEINTLNDLPGLMTNGTLQKGKQYYIQNNGTNHLNIILSYGSDSYYANTPMILNLVKTMYMLPK